MTDVLVPTVQQLPYNLPEKVEAALMEGDLSKMSTEDRLAYYDSVCKSLGLNPLTRPFDYINLSGKLTLYAKRDAADQLRKLNGVTIEKPDVQINDDLIIVSVTARDKTGREDSELGVVSVGNLKGDQKANAIMKAITKAKRRVTLSLCGLGWLDETETETIPGAQLVDTTTGELIPAATPTQPGRETRQQARERLRRQAPAVAGVCEAQSAPAEAQPKAANELVCAVCGRAVTAGQKAASEHRFGKPLCPQCQRKAQEQAQQQPPAQDAPAPAAQQQAKVEDAFTEDPFAG